MPETMDHQGTLPIVAADFHDLPDDRTTWCSSPANNCIARRLDAHRYVAVTPFMYTHAIIWGHIGDDSTYEDRWCYDHAHQALAAATAWDGASGTEPDGWHRHPRTGRRRPNGDPALEYINP